MDRLAYNYYDPSHPAEFAGVTLLIKESKKDPAKVQEWLLSADTKEGSPRQWKSPLDTNTPNTKDNTYHGIVLPIVGAGGVIIREAFECTASIMMSGL
uniref:Uncharacterized protein n=1 Tax=Timema bartmani TaxID=61472 RepID=A0A7R9F908_9NEOP|nr:unnamed protein product [Timema bartmani]